MHSQPGQWGAGSSVLSSRNSPRGMLSSQALKEMYLRTASRATVDAMTYWDNHVAVTNMRQAVMREQHEMRLSSRPTSARDRPRPSRV